MLQSKYKHDLMVLVAFSIVAIAVIFIRVFFAFTFPIPWCDEIDFIAPAFELSRSGTLFVEALNPGRIVMWMPPGYTILLAGMFKLFGYSFSLARWISAVCLMSTYAATIMVVRRSLNGYALAAALICSLLAFLSPYTLAISNFARMESFYIFTLMLALLITVVGRPWFGLAIVVLTGLIHFNAVYFLLPYFAYCLDLLIRRCKPQVSRADIAALVVSVIAWFVYAYFVAQQWQGFDEDMHFQFGLKSWGPALGGPKGVSLMIAVSSIFALSWCWSKRFSEVAFIAGFGVAFILVHAKGRNMWYTAAECVGFYLLAVSTIMMYSQARQQYIKKISTVAFILLSLALVYFSYLRITPQFQPLWPRSDLFKKEFITSYDLDRVKKFIGLAKSDTIFNFGHTGVEAFFLGSMYEKHLRWIYTVNSVTRPLPFRRADYRVTCDSSLIPKYLSLYAVDEYAPKSLDNGCRIWDLNSGAEVR